MKIYSLISLIRSYSLQNDTLFFFFSLAYLLPLYHHLSQKWVLDLDLKNLLDHYRIVSWGTFPHQEQFIHDFHY